MNVDRFYFSSTVVIHSQRYSDLEKYVYIPEEQSPGPRRLRVLKDPFGGPQVNSIKEFKKLHPVATLSFKQVCKNHIFDPILRLYNLFRNVLVRCVIAIHQLGYLVHTRKCEARVLVQQSLQ